MHQIWIGRSIWAAEFKFDVVQIFYATLTIAERFCIFPPSNYSEDRYFLHLVNLGKCWSHITSYFQIHRLLILIKYWKLESEVDIFLFLFKAASKTIPKWFWNKKLHFKLHIRDFRPLVVCRTEMKMQKIMSKKEKQKTSRSLNVVYLRLCIIVSSM